MDNHFSMAVKVKDLILGLSVCVHVVIHVVIHPWPWPWYRLDYEEEGKYHQFLIFYFIKSD